jgi:hypothetical protein
MRLMARTGSPLLLAAVLLAGFSTSVGAMAQSASGSVGVQIVEPRLGSLRTAADPQSFGQISSYGPPVVATDAGDGAAPSTFVQRFTISGGEPFESFGVALPNQKIELDPSEGSGAFSVTALPASQAAVRLGVDGAGSFDLLGRLSVLPGTPAGSYTGLVGVTLIGQ